MKKLFKIIAALMISFSGTSQTIWNYNPASCMSPYSVCVVTDDGVHSYSVYGYDDTTYFFASANKIILRSLQWQRISSATRLVAVTDSGTMSGINVSQLNTNQFTNGAGFITGINSSNVTTALGFTPYNSTNPNGYINSFTEVDGSTTNEIELPSQTGNAGKLLTTDGNAVSWGSLSGYLQGNTGSATVSGTALQTAYVITHSLGYTPTSISIQAKSANASVLSYISAITSTTFTITFISVPILGTNNISFYWVAYK